MEVNLVDAIFGKNNDKEKVLICIPSISLNKKDLSGITAVNHYKTRSLWQIGLSGEKLKVIYLTKVDLDHTIIDYYKEAMNVSNFEIIKIKDSGDDSLVDELLKNDVICNIKNKYHNRDIRILSFLNTEKEYELSEITKLPIFSNYKCSKQYQTKSGNKEIFRESGIKFAEGFENINTPEGLIEKISKMKSNKVMVKLNEGVSGNGDALLIKDENFNLNNAETYLEKIRFQQKDLNWDYFKDRLVDGSIIEEFLEGENETSPSVQGVVGSDGHVYVFSTHEQILDENGNCYLGCSYPSRESYRNEIKEDTLKIGEVLSSKGFVGFFAVDYVVFEEDAEQRYAIEINMRQGGTTHPYFTSKLLASNNDFYIATDNFYINLTWKELFEKVKEKGLLYRNGRGILFHLQSALANYKKVGYIIVGTSYEDCENQRLKLESLGSI